MSIEALAANERIDCPLEVAARRVDMPLADLGHFRPFVDALRDHMPYVCLDEISASLRKVPVAWWWLGRAWLKPGAEISTRSAALEARITSSLSDLCQGQPCNARSSMLLIDYLEEL